MLRDEIKQLKSGPRELRNFGLLVGGVFAFLAAWFFSKHNPLYILFATIAAPLIVLGLVYPAGLRLIYIGWMTLALFLGIVVSTIILTLFFSVIVTPVGLLARCFGKDFLSRKFNAQTGSYWIHRTEIRKQKAEYEQQF